MVAIFFARLRAGERPKIFGDGSADARLRLRRRRRPRDGRRGHDDGGVFNVGTGRETSVVELLELCQRVAGDEPDAQFVPARPGELQRSVLDPSLAVDELGWRPEHSLEDGLRET